MDNWNILLESQDDGCTVATILEVPNLQSVDKTKQGAIEKVRQLLQERLAKAEIIQISLPKKTHENPLMKFAGVFENDSDFQEIMSEIRAERENN
ncbi:MAG TPA: hypothetical protein DCF68_16230 [Cyanothece sp. UBA12306]|nr:hypothetical protein [Cyanothece sp. UBA12306]